MNFHTHDSTTPDRKIELYWSDLYSDNTQRSQKAPLGKISIVHMGTIIKKYIVTEKNNIVGKRKGLKVCNYLLSYKKRQVSSG